MENTLQTQYSTHLAGHLAGLLLLHQSVVFQLTWQFYRQT